MDLEAKRGNCIEHLDVEASCGPQLASEIDMIWGGIGKCRKLSRIDRL